MGLNSELPKLQRLRFGAFELDLRSGELTRLGKRCRLQEQPFRLLSILVETPGDLVSREELHGRLWPSTTIDFDHALNKAVSKIRVALGDSAESPRFIETVARRGYRFIGDVTFVDDLPARTVAQDPEEPATPNQPEVSVLAKRSQRFRWVSLGVSVLALSAVIIWISERPVQHGSQTIHSMAVLPLANLSGDPAQEYFADGMTDELITTLGHIESLSVISRTSAMTYKNSGESLPEIARALNVDAILEGSVLHSGNQIRISTQLIRASDDREMFAKSYDGDINDALGLQSRIATDVAEHIRITLDRGLAAALQTTSQVKPGAYDDYLRGRYVLNQRTPDALRKAIEYFRRSTDADPLFAESFSGLADAYALSGDWKYGILPLQEASPKAKAAVSKALALDSRLGEAHATLAYTLDLYDWNWNEAEKEFKLAVQLDPGYATAYQWYSWHLIIIGQTEAAMNELRKAQELDPVSLIISADMADDLTVARRYDDAANQSRGTLELDPNFAVGHFELGQALLQKQDASTAISEFQRAIALSGQSGAFESNLGFAYAISGRTDEARGIISALKSRLTNDPSASADIALVYLGLGDRDRAIMWLDKAIPSRFKVSILRHPVFDSLRSDPRFRALLSNIGLPQ